jgi:hypothetical protein
MIGGYALEATDRNGLVFDPATATGRLTGSVANPTQYPREDIGFAVFHVRIAELPLGNHADIRGHVGMRRATPLAVDYLVKIFGLGGICWLHSDVRAGRFFTQR